MNVIDYVILGLILICALMGFKKGLINSIVSLIGVLIIIVLSFYLKNPISTILYDKLSFFELFGKFKGVQTLNIIFREAVSYIVVLIIIGFVVGIITKVTGIVGKISNHVPLIGLASRIGGLICGVLEGVVIAFVLTFLLGLISGTADLVSESKYSDLLLTKTPALSSIVEDTYLAVNEIYEICIDYEDDKDKNLANQESLKVLLKYNIITPTSADKLIENNKLDFPLAKDIVDRYRKSDK